MERQQVDRIRQWLGARQSELVKDIKSMLARRHNVVDSTKLARPIEAVTQYQFIRQGELITDFSYKGVGIQTSTGRLEFRFTKLCVDDLVRLYILIDKMKPGQGWLRGDITDYSSVTLDSTITDYCRWESESRSETARIMGDWLEVLERVGAEILNQTDCEVSFRLTLRQAFETGWEWDSSDGCPERYLASLLEGEWEDEVEARETPSDHPLVKHIEKMWDDWREAQEKQKAEQPTAAG